MLNPELQLFKPEQPLISTISSMPQSEEHGKDILGINPQKSLEQAISRIFPTGEEENDIQKAKRILGEIVEGMPDQDVKVFVTEAQYLISYWFDCFEKSIFDGSTLKQILKEV